MSDKKYIGTYKVIKFFKKSRKRKIIKKDLTRDEAIKLVKSFPDSNTSLVGFEKQFYADKYFV